MLRRVSNLAVGHLREARIFFYKCSLYVNLYGRNSTYMIKLLLRGLNITILKISLWLKYGINYFN